MPPEKSSGSEVVRDLYRRLVLCAQAGALLIDDSDHNVIQFRNHGGQAILFPQIWNSNHHLPDPLAHVERELNRLSRSG